MPQSSIYGLLSDTEIDQLCKSSVRDGQYIQSMIDPYVNHQTRELNDRRVISFGLSSYGYDIRVDRQFKIFTPGLGDLTVIDPKLFDTRAMIDFEGDECIIPPNSFALARSVEYLRIPRDILCVCLGKSTYARCGIIVNVTPFEPQWEGHVTIEISNTAPLPARIYAGEGIAQVLFFRAQDTCLSSYADKQGKYQAQQGIALPMV